MSSEHAVDRAAMVISREIKWPRGLRLAVVLASATVSWVAVVGAGYLIVRMF